MNKQLVITALGAFALGFGGGYMVFFAPSPAPSVSATQPAPSSVAQLATHPPQLAALPESPQTALKKQQLPPATETLEVAPEQPMDAANNTSDIDTLRRELAAAKQTIATYKHILDAPSDMEAELKERFTHQERDEAWAYDVETKVSDFVYSQGLAYKIKLDTAQCKQTVCRLQFSAQEDVELDPRDDWHNIQNTLMEQPWWQQFHRTNSRSSEAGLNLWVERLPPSS